ncbi:mitochondrial carrier domain-containing protein, partial [Bipolaris maydis]
KSTSSFIILRSTVEDPGTRGVYAGCQTLAISNALKSGGLFFFFFETAKRNLTTYFLSPTMSNGSAVRNSWLKLTSMLCTGATESVLVVTPGEAFIHDAASGGHLGRLSVSQLVAYTARQDGVLPLWKGLMPVLRKQGKNSAVGFTTFGTLNDQLREVWPEKMCGATTTTFTGAGSGIMTVLMIYGYASMLFDNIKTRIQSIGNYRGSVISIATKMLIKERLFVF